MTNHPWSDPWSWQHSVSKWHVWVGGQFHLEDLYYFTRYYFLDLVTNRRNFYDPT